MSRSKPAWVARRAAQGQIELRQRCRRPGRRRSQQLPIALVEDEPQSLLRGLLGVGTVRRHRLDHEPESARLVIFQPQGRITIRRRSIEILHRQKTILRIEARRQRSALRILKGVNG